MTKIRAIYCKFQILSIIQPLWVESSVRSANFHASLVKDLLDLLLIFTYRAVAAPNLPRITWAAPLAREYISYNSRLRKCHFSKSI